MPAAPLTFLVGITSAASIDEIWRVLGDFGGEHRWTKTLVACERDTAEVRVGTARICTLPKPLMGRTKVREELTEFDPGNALAYALDGDAGPFETAASRWRTQPASDGTRISVEGHFTAKNAMVQLVVWPIVKPMLKRLTRRVILELDSFVRNDMRARA